MCPLKFWVTSDLHYGLRARSDRATERLALDVCARAKQGDVLVLVGDLGKGQATLERCLELFDGFPGPKLAVPGNHDVWLLGWEDRDVRDSWDLHEVHLREVFERCGFHALHCAPWVGDGVACVGSMGWYDYSFRDDIGIDLESYRTKTPPWTSFPIWNDARFARFGCGDEELTIRLDTRLRAHLAAVPDGVPVLGFVHHVVTKSLLVHPRSRVPKRWRYANAFLGAESTGRILAQDARVSHVLCGHIHMEMTSHKDNVSFRTLGSDYVRKQLLCVAPKRGVLESWYMDHETTQRAL